MWMNGLSCLTGNQMIDGSSPEGTDMNFRFLKKFLYILIIFSNIKKSLNFLIETVKVTVKICHVYQ